MQAYKQFVDEANMKIKEKYMVYRSLIDSICDIEESKVELLKGLIRRVVECFEHMGKVLIDKATAISSAVSFISKRNEMHMIGTECGKKEFAKTFAPLEFTPYRLVPSSELESEDDQVFYERYFSSTDSMSENAINHFFRQAIDTLRSGKTMNLEEKARVVELLHHKPSRSLFAQNLSTMMGSRIYLTSLESFKILGDLIKYLLTAYVLEKDSDPVILLDVLDASISIAFKVRHTSLTHSVEQGGDQIFVRTAVGTRDLAGRRGVGTAAEHGDRT